MVSISLDKFLPNLIADVSERRGSLFKIRRNNRATYDLIVNMTSNLFQAAKESFNNFQEPDLFKGNFWGKTISWGWSMLPVDGRISLVCVLLFFLWSQRSGNAKVKNHIHFNLANSQTLEPSIYPSKLLIKFAKDQPTQVIDLFNLPGQPERIIKIKNGNVVMSMSQEKFIQIMCLTLLQIYKNPNQEINLFDRSNRPEQIIKIKSGDVVMSMSQDKFIEMMESTLLRIQENTEEKIKIVLEESLATC